jgi:hypothetical protein
MAANAAVRDADVVVRIFKNLLIASCPLLLIMDAFRRTRRSLAKSEMQRWIVSAAQGNSGVKFDAESDEAHSKSRNGQ